MRRLLSALSVSLIYASASAAELPEAYRVITRRNLFSPSRTPAALPTAAAAVTAPPPPTETVTLTGVVFLEGEVTALFSGSPALGGLRRVGEQLDLGTVRCIDTAGVTLDPGPNGVPLRLPVGQSLRRVIGQPWEVSDGPPPETGPLAAVAGGDAPAGAAVANSPAGEAAGAAPAGAGDGDLLKRLMERRKKELNP